MALFEVLDVMVDSADSEGYIRLRCENDIIKYIVIKQNTFGYESPPARSKIAAQIPELPSGDWTTIQLSKNEIDGRLKLDAPERVELAKIENLWHPVKIDYFDLEFESINFDVFEVRMREEKPSSSSPNLPLVMIAKICAYPCFMQLWNRENEIYLKLNHKGIAPNFLGYIIENNGIDAPRAIGILLQKVEGHHALSMSDLPICLNVLRKFHSVTGCRHGDANRGNFIVKPDGSGALIIDFSFSHQGSKKSMENEIKVLIECMTEDDESKRNFGEKNFLEDDLKDRLGGMKPMTNEEDERRDEIGIDLWVEEKIMEISEGKTRHPLITI